MDLKAASTAYLAGLDMANTGDLYSHFAREKRIILVVWTWDLPLRLDVGSEAHLRVKLGSLRKER